MSAAITGNEQYAKIVMIFLSDQGVEVGIDFSIKTFLNEIKK